MRAPIQFNDDNTASSFGYDVSDRGFHDLFRTIHAMGYQALWASAAIPMELLDEFTELMNKEYGSHSHTRDLISSSRMQVFCIKEFDLYIYYYSHGQEDAGNYIRTIQILSKPAMFYSNVQDFLNKYSAFFNPPKDLKKRKNVNIYYRGAHGLEWDTSWVSMDKKSMIFPELYPNINIDQLAQDFVESNESILMLYGPPGVGKTTFVRYLILSTRKDFTYVYTKDEDILENAEFWSKMSLDPNHMVLLDDLGPSIKDRGDRKESVFIDFLLSTSDSIYGVNPKIIITTNINVDSIDDALKRPGRTFDFITLEAVSNDHARSLWTDTLKANPAYFDREFSKKTTITQAELMSSYRAYSSKREKRRYIIKEGRSPVKQEIGL
jgi:hypothetical protein